LLLVTQSCCNSYRKEAKVEAAYNALKRATVTIRVSLQIIGLLSKLTWASSDSAVLGSWRF